MSGHLKLQYEQRLQDLFDLDERLDRERQAETKLQERVAEILRQADRSDLLDQVWRPTGYEPGADINAALARTGRQVQLRAGLLGRSKSPPILVGMWPDATVNARAEKSEGGGGVLYVNTGLISFLRILAQYAAASAANLLENPKLGADIDAGEVRALAEHSIVGIVVGADFRAEAGVWAMQGPRDGFRRELIETAISYVIAHEYAHLINVAWGGGINCAALNLRGHLQPLSEGQVLNSQHDELEADAKAYEILYADYARAPAEHLIMVALGACLAMAGQMATYWMALGMGSDDWGWSHPLPDMRLQALFEALQQRNLKRPEHRVMRFIEWAEGAFAIKDARARTNERLDQRG